MPPDVAMVFSRFGPAVQYRLSDLRQMIFEQAESDPRMGPITETLRWGEMAYITKHSRSGTTLRLGRAGEACAVFVNCRTSLIETYSDLFGDKLTFQGKRAVILADHRPLPRAELALCLRLALTYHLRRD